MADSSLISVEVAAPVGLDHWRFQTREVDDWLWPRRDRSRGRRMIAQVSEAPDCTRTAPKPVMRRGPNQQLVTGRALRMSGRRGER